MDFETYQKEALRTDRVPAHGDDDVASLIVPMLGLAGETGQLLSEYKKHLRDGEAHRLFKERVSEELGDLMWYVANVASKFGLALDGVAVANLEKTRGRFLSDRAVPDSFDAGLPDGAPFLESMCHLASDDHVRAYLLFCDERPIAYMYCPVRDGVLLYQYVGYDPAYQHGSPGTVLQYLALEQIFAEGKFLYFDFTEGQGQHKEQLATHAALCANICYFRPSWRSFLVLWCHQALDRISRLVVGGLDRLGLKGRIKRFVRTWHWRS